jgi:hypothetical protein
MKVMRLRTPGEAVQPDESPLPVFEPRQVLLEVQACGVCRTDLHLQDGELPDIPYPVTPRHEIVGRLHPSTHPPHFSRRGEMCNLRQLLVYVTDLPQVRQTRHDWIRHQHREGHTGK